MNSLFADLPSSLAHELIETLLEESDVRIERIVSTGHASPEGFWYDQAEHEWVIVLQGAARLLLEGEVSALEMGPGNYIHIPAHKRHRVTWTTPHEPTVWLAVFYRTTVARQRN